MNHKPEFEVVIVRNTTVQSLYDVIRVDYMSEQVEFVAKALDFADAVGIKLELEETN